MFGKTIWLPKNQLTSSMWEDLILLHFYFQMLNDINTKNSWDSLRCKYQIKQITKIREENGATNENCILRKMALKFQNLSFHILYKIAFWKSGWEGVDYMEWAAQVKGQPVWCDSFKNDKLHSQENFWSHRTEPACIHHSQPAQ